MFSSIGHKIVPRSCFVRVLDCAQILGLRTLNCARFFFICSLNCARILVIRALDCAQFLLHPALFPAYLEHCHYHFCTTITKKINFLNLASISSSTSLFFFFTLHDYTMNVYKWLRCTGQARRQKAAANSFQRRSHVGHIDGCYVSDVYDIVWLHFACMPDCCFWNIYVCYSMNRMILNGSWK